MDGYWAERQLYMQISNEEKIPLANLSCLTGRDRIEVRFLEKCVNLEKITQNHIFFSSPPAHLVDQTGGHRATIYHLWCDG